MNEMARFLRFILTKGLLLGTGLIVWVLWRSFWPGDLWAEAVGILGLIAWFVLVWLTTVSRYILLHGKLSLSRCLWLGLGMSFTSIALFSIFLMLKLNTGFPSLITDWVAEPTYLLVLISSTVLILVVASIHWFSDRWQHPDGIDF